MERKGARQAGSRKSGCPGPSQRVATSDEAVAALGATTEMRDPYTAGHQRRVACIAVEIGKLLGLDKTWLANAVKATGNYGEIFERNVGPKSPLGLPRGINNLWNKGGVVYPMPIR